MSEDILGLGKLPGKTLYAGRRRAATRTSGFKVHEHTTGGEFRRQPTDMLVLRAGEAVSITFELRGHAPDDLLRYGVWFWSLEPLECCISGGPAKRTLTNYRDPSWNKLGSIWQAENDAAVTVSVVLHANVDTSVSLYSPMCGTIRHRHLDGARGPLLKNMYQFSPEALFISDDETGVAIVCGSVDGDEAGHRIVLKSCNRCGRYLPINETTERDQLSFSNHCVATHRRPCKHTTFGRLRNDANCQDILTLDYGFQLECRFCKKFEVNAAHNPQRSSAQMKEDGARRRAFEFLLAALYNGTPQLRYRQAHGSELADDVWRRFGCACFNCGTSLPTTRDMNLDHTRPLALLWPLDGTATALCKSCNSAKRDLPPSEFYARPKLVELAQITGVEIADLIDAPVNEAALATLLAKQDWLFEDFLMRPEMTKERDGKIAGELVVKSLQKVIARSAKHPQVDLEAAYQQRRR